MFVKYKIFTDYRPCIKAVLVLQYIVETAKYKRHLSILKGNIDLTIKLVTCKYGFVVKLRFLRSNTYSWRKISIKAFSTFEQSVVNNIKVLEKDTEGWVNGCLSPKIHFHNANEKCISLYTKYVWLEIVVVLALVLD